MKSVFALVALLALVLAGGVPAGAVEVTKFKGSITDVGIQRGPGQVGGVEFRIQGEFLYDLPVDLGNATLTLYELFAENGPGGAGELMKMMDEASFLPLAMLASDASEPDEGKYETQNFRPQIRVQIESDDDEFEFRLKLDRGLMRKLPKLCTIDPKDKKPYTWITHTFALDDGVNPVLLVSTTKRWDCVNLKGFQMKSR